MKSKILCLVFLCSPPYLWGQSEVISSLRKNIKSYSVNNENNIEKSIKIKADLGKTLSFVDAEEALLYCEEAIKDSWQLEAKGYASYAWSSMYIAIVNGKKDGRQKALDSTIYYAEQSGSAIVMGNAYYTAGYSESRNAVEYLLKGLSLFGKKHESADLKYNMLLPHDEITYKIAHAYYLIAQVNGILKDQEKYARLLYLLSQENNTSSSAIKQNIDVLANAGMGSFLSNKYYYRGNRAVLDSAVYFLKTAVSRFEKNESCIFERKIGGRTSLLLAKELMDNYQGTSVNTILDLLDKAHRWSGECNDLWAVDSYRQLRTDLLKKHPGYGRQPVKKAADITNNTAIRSNQDSLFILVDSLSRLVVAGKEEPSHNYSGQRAIINNHYAFIIVGLTAIIVLLLLLFLVSKMLKRSKKTTEINAAADLRTQNEQLQKEMLATAIQLHQKTEVLQTIQKEISKPNNQLDKIIRENLSADNYFEDYKTLIKETHPNFYNTLQEQAEGKLTDLDLKYCTYIYMKIPSKQIANLLHVEYNTVRMSKYRLKQKLNLSKDDDLYKFIQNIQEQQY